MKDELLGCYLTPYVTKIIHTCKPLIYVDCFAGKGKFDDGNPGSPLIALNIFKQVLSKTKLSKPAEVKSIFIDSNYTSDLTTNLAEYKNIEIVSGAYEDTIEEILKSKIGSNVFLYIDPYGIKNLNCIKFDTFASGKFNTIELLINMNSFGFIREACNAMRTQFKVEDSYFFDDLVEYDPNILDATDKSIEALNSIAGGVYWKDIIVQYKKGEIDGYKAEEYFSEKYSKRLSKNYKYVLNIPIRIKRNQHPKYRMIHATNHPAGCILMADNICERWELLKNIQNNRQLTLLPETFDNKIINEKKIDEYVIEFFSQFNEWISITEAQALFFVKYGAICKTGNIAEALKKLEGTNHVKVHRKPNETKKGKPSTFMTESHGKTVLVKWVK